VIFLAESPQQGILTIELLSVLCSPHHSIGAAGSNSDEFTSMILAGNVQFSQDQTNQEQAVAVDSNDRTSKSFRNASASNPLAFPVLLSLILQTSNLNSVSHRSIVMTRNRTALLQYLMEIIATERSVLFC
jgi:hypothetical protein